ncbi:MAG: nicotinamidase [Acidimicrobiaceae bacterium]|nr:nicotinamidase [Acidimicrobiaceae bacterium]|tara:strand:- start:784 stop:1380 length:597 start_codon:yes stop_codon:yes gene_type:complete
MTIKSKIALLVVDVQPTFCEGGSLPVNGGNSVAQRISQLLSGGHGYDMIITTQDWHIDPGEHFHENPDYIDNWPKHGVAGTAEAELHPALKPFLDQITFQVKKGEYDAAYSGFEGVDERGVTLDELLTSGNITRIETAGLAFDYCVKETALDGVKLGYEVIVLKPLTAPVSKESANIAEQELLSAGVQISEELEERKW